MKTLIIIIIATIFTANSNAQSKFALSINGASNNVKLTGNSGAELKCELGANGPAITWETLNEANTSHFELQVSYDGNNFSTIRKIAASDVTEWNTTYKAQFHKNYVSVEKVYYRLKVIFTNTDETVTAPIAFTMPNRTKVSYASIH